MTRQSSKQRPPVPEIPGYANLRLIGIGGMASVYTAVQESLGRQVALKLLNKPDDGSRYERFLNESRIIASLNHRNVITIHDVGAVNGRPYISMEFLRGGDLAQRLLEGPVESGAALDLIEAMAHCLAFVHDHGVVHRDIKPANILFHEDGTPILTDFGLAKQQEADRHLTMDGTTVGTPYYISPEQAECEVVDGRTDIYGLGVILYEMLVGARPFEAESAMQTIVAHLTSPIPALPPGLSRYQDLIDRMLAKDPADRFASAGQLVEAMQSLSPADGESVAHAYRGVQTFAEAGWLQPIKRRVVAAAAAFRARDGLPVELARRLSRLVAGLSTRARIAGAASLLIIAIGTAGYLGRLQPATVREYLAEAEAALEDDRLSYPKAGSALYYYEQVLELEPGNSGATEGLSLIAERYADLAEAEILDSEFPTARFYVDRGLDVQPDNPRLLQLQREIKPLSTVPQKIANGFRSLFNGTRRRDE